MTPDVTFKAWYDGKIKVAAVSLHENYSAGYRGVSRNMD